METGKALEIVHGMASRLYKKNHALTYGIANTPSEAQEALDTVEDLIVNNFDEEHCKHKEEMRHD